MRSNDKWKKCHGGKNLLRHRRRPRMFTVHLRGGGGAGLAQFKTVAVTHSFNVKVSFTDLVFLETE